MSISKNKATGRWQSHFKDARGRQHHVSSKKHFPKGLIKREAYYIEAKLIRDINLNDQIDFNTEFNAIIKKIKPRTKVSDIVILKRQLFQLISKNNNINIINKAVKKYEAENWMTTLPSKEDIATKETIFH